MAWLAESTTDRKMLSLLVVQSFRLHKFERKSNVLVKTFNFLTGDCGVGVGWWF